MIALDLVFGLDGKSTESVSRRTAALVYRQRGLASKEQFVRLQKLYKRRSDYVHRGESVSKKELVELDEICQQTLWCLLTVAGKGEISGIDEFLQQVDLIAAAEVAGEPLEEERYSRLGIPAPGESRKRWTLDTDVDDLPERFLFPLAD